MIQNYEPHEEEWHAGDLIANQRAKVVSGEPNGESKDDGIEKTEEDIGVSNDRRQGSLQTVFIKDIERKAQYERTLKSRKQDYDAVRLPQERLKQGYRYCPRKCFENTLPWTINGSQWISWSVRGFSEVTVPYLVILTRAHHILQWEFRKFFTQFAYQQVPEYKRHHDYGRPADHANELKLYPAPVREKYPEQQSRKETDDDIRLHFNGDVSRDEDDDEITNHILLPEKNLVRAIGYPTQATECNRVLQHTRSPKENGRNKKHTVRQLLI